MVLIHLSSLRSMSESSYDLHFKFSTFGELLLEGFRFPGFIDHQLQSSQYVLQTFMFVSLHSFVRLAFTYPAQRAHVTNRWS